MSQPVDLFAVLESAGGVICRRDHPELRGSIDRAVRTGRLTAVLPGTYAATELAALADTRVRAVAARHRDAVLVGAAAARLTYWPAVPLTTIPAAVAGAARPQAGFDFIRRRVPPELVLERHGLRMTAPALTAIELATFANADAIDVALRTRAATLAGMHEALRLTAHRPGNAERMRLLIDSRDQPWSAAERLAHRLLRQAGITGWCTNHPVWVDGFLYYIDIAVRARKLAFEIDGRLHETNEDLFQSDRRRQNALVLTGWQVLRFTWEMLTEYPEEFIAAVRFAMR